VFEDQDFVSLFPEQRAAGICTVATGTRDGDAVCCLSDREASAVRTRIDWKYLLRLELTDSGFDYSILSRFRDRLIGATASQS